MKKEAIQIQDGRTIDYTLTADTSVGDVVSVGPKFVGIAAVSGLTGESIALHAEGVYSIAAKSEDAIKVGDTVYFDASARALTTTESGNSRAGVALTAKAANAAGAVDIKLNVG